MFKRHILLFFCIFSSTAFAENPAFHFEMEPYTGWELFGKIGPFLGIEILNTLSGRHSNADKFNGFILGTRISALYHEKFFLGLDVSAAPLLNFSTYDTSKNKYVMSDSANNIKFGAVLGAILPIAPIRIWTGFNFIDNTFINAAPCTESFKVSSTGETLFANNAVVQQIFYASSLKIGASYTVMKNININAEYLHIFYSSKSMYGIKASIINYNGANTVVRDLFSHLLVITVSAPFRFDFI